MKVAWIVPGFSSGEDDWCIPALLDLARALARVCDLNIVAMRYPYRRGRYSVAGALVHSIGGAHGGPLSAPSIWRDTARAARETGCDVLHAFWAYEPGVIAARFARQVPVVTSLGGGELVCFRELGYGLWGKRRRRILMRWALSRAAAITAGSQFMAELARRVTPLPALRYLPLGVDLRRWPPPPRPEGPPVVLTVGSLEPVKGHSVLVRAFEIVQRQAPAARLRIAGGGRTGSELEGLARCLGLSEQVEFAGQVPHHELPAIYAGSSVYVQGSWHESQGMAVLEAAACGLPIAGTRVGALADLAPDAATAVSAGDHRGLADAILHLLRNRDEAARLGRSARREVEEAYDVEAAADRFLKLYRSLI
jgi:glycosyltransferase involved in cell wall biosynthesis